MADALVASVLAGPHERPVTPVALGLVMTDAALFGGADDEAHLEDFGPIPAELAREIVCGAVTAEEELSIRRLYTSPTTGELVAMDARTRTFRGNLAKFVRLRDRTCRTPWCDAPVRHVDHVTDWQKSRTTSGRSGQGLLRGVQLRQDGTTMAVQSRAGRQRDDHASHRPHPHDQAASDRDDQAAAPASTSDRLRDCRLSGRAPLTRPAGRGPGR